MLYACGQAKQTYSRNSNQSSPRPKRKENIIIITWRKRMRDWEEETEKDAELCAHWGVGGKFVALLWSPALVRQLSLCLSPPLCLTAVFPGCLRIFDFNANKPKPQRERERAGERESAINWQWQPQTKNVAGKKKLFLSGPRRST